MTWIVWIFIEQVFSNLPAIVAVFVVRKRWPPNDFFNQKFHLSMFMEVFLEQKFSVLMEFGHFGPDKIFRFQDPGRKWPHCIKEVKGVIFRVITM